MLAIVDTHQHLWDLSKLSLPWAAGDAILDRNFLTDDYLEATSEVDLDCAIYMEVDVAPDQKVAEAEYVISLCQEPNTPTVAAVIGGDPAIEGFHAYVMRFAESPYVKGVRQVLHVPDRPPGYCLSAQFIQGVEALGDNDLRFDLCMRPSELADGAELARRVPQTRFIVDHCGNADPYIVSGATDATNADDPFAHDRQQWMDDISALAELPNVIIKISGIIARTKPGWTAADLAPTIDHCLNAFGPERAVFGGDWPVCLYGGSYIQWVSALREVVAARPESERRKLLQENARSFYGLDSQK